MLPEPDDCLMAPCSIHSRSVLPQERMLDCSRLMACVQLDKANVPQPLAGQGAWFCDGTTWRQRTDKERLAQQTMQRSLEARASVRHLNSFMSIKKQVPEVQVDDVEP